MTIQLQLPDAVYASLLNGTARVQGTIALINPNEGNFNVHHRHRHGGERKYIKLPHGRASVDDKSVRLALNIALDETNVRPNIAILDESLQASDFVHRMIKEGGVA